MDWKKDVLKFVAAKTKEIKEKTNLKQAEALAKAWKDPDVIKMKEEYHRKKKPAEPKKTKPKKK